LTVRTTLTSFFTFPVRDPMSLPDILPPKLTLSYSSTIFLQITLVCNKEETRKKRVMGDR
jgi:hypothetical protein